MSGLTLDRRQPTLRNYAAFPVEYGVAKVAQITLLFWIIKIIATTLGETSADLLSMTLGLGYITSTAILLIFFASSLMVQLLARSFHPALYWCVILSTTMAGTTLSDYLDRTARLGYLGGAAVIGAGLASVLMSWRLTTGSIAINGLDEKPAEAFYWLAILASNTLGTALGDSLSDSLGLGYSGDAALVGAGLSLLAVLYAFTRSSRTALFWAAFVLTRPLGATLGDLLTKPAAKGGLALGTQASSLVLCLSLAGLVVFSARSRARVLPG